MKLDSLENCFHKFSFSEKDKILLAISGGVDSVVLAHLCKQAELNFSLAHCNFRLRGAESNADEDFVQNLAKKLEVPLYIEYFDTEDYAKENKLSIQMAARKLRYDWFEKLTADLGFTYLLTAHHANDSLETFLINTTRGTGLEGLIGIPEKNKNILRPLLSFTRKQILAYAEANALSWREDSSNLSEKYLRNKIRHKVIPVLAHENPQLMDNFLKTQAHLQDALDLLEEYSQQLHREIITERGEELYLDIQKISEKNKPGAVLYQLLKDYGFRDWEKVESLLTAQSGKVIFSSTHRLIKNRNELILDRLSSEKFPELKISAETRQKLFPGWKLVFEKTNTYKKSGRNEIFVDYDKMKFPLLLRKGKPGDWFYPFGMKGRKKLSKFLKDEKFSLPEKEKIWVLLSGNKIVWIVGIRPDERFKVTSGSKNILKISLEERG